MKSRILGWLAAVVGLSLVGSAAHAQTLFTGSGCSGNTFEFCASWTGTYVDATHFSLFVTNLSGSAPANNLDSAFTQIAIGNVTAADPASMAAVTGWQFDPNINGFLGFGLLENQFGSITTNGINNALQGGQSQLFAFTFGSSIGTFGQAQGAFGAAQIAIHDQGYLVAGCSSKGVLPGNTAGSNNFNGPAGCGITTTVPEPGTLALLSLGLLGLGLSRRRTV